MFGDQKGTEIRARIGRSLISAFLVFSFFHAALSSHTTMVSGQSKRSAQSLPGGIPRSLIRMDSFTVERFKGAVKIIWQTAYEQNVVGYQVWRETNGVRRVIGEELIAGSLFKVGNGVLPAGSRYETTDRDGLENADYYLESINLSAQSKWFGPAVTVPATDRQSSWQESKTLTALNRSLKGRQQIDQVDFPATSATDAGTKVQVSPNDWLPADPNALQIQIRQRGMYRIDAATLAEMNFRSAESNNWKLFVGGVEQPAVVNPDGSLEFFASPIDTLQTETNVYWLTTAATAGMRISRQQLKTVRAGRDGYYSTAAERKDKIYRVSSILNGARENWFGPVVNSAASDQTLSLSDVALNAQSSKITLGVNLQGLTNSSHLVSVALNGLSVGQISFNSYERAEWMMPVPAAYLREGINTVTLRALGDSSDISITESIRINYPRRLKAQNDRLEYSQPAGQAAQLKNFTTPNVRVFDVTDPARTTEYAPAAKAEADGTYSVTIPAARNQRLLIALGGTAPFLTAAALTLNQPSNLKSAQNQAKFVIIAPREFIPELSALRDLRTTEGIRTVIVDIEDIYDEFNFGIRSAEAIRAFLQYAKQNWAAEPDYVLLAGDASADPRNYTGMGGDSVNRVPSLFTDTWNMDTVTDEMLVDFDGDDVGEMSLGRLPAQNVGQLRAMLEKILAFRPMSVSAINQRGLHFISDTSIYYDFPGGSRNAASVMPPDVSINYLDRAMQDGPSLRGEIVNRFNSAPAIVNFFGDGALTAWTGAQIFRVDEARSLRNGEHQPLVVMLACLTGDYVETQESLADALMKRNGGGAFAVWAASGWNTAQAQEYMAREFYQRVFDGMPLGDAAREAKATTVFTDQKRTYVLFGDPTLPLVAP